MNEKETTTKSSSVKLPPGHPPVNTSRQEDGVDVEIRCPMRKIWNSLTSSLSPSSK